MNEIADRILEAFPIRYNNNQKSDFRKFMISEFGFKEEGLDDTFNLYNNFVDSKIIFTAHYDTPLQILEIRFFIYFIIELLAIFKITSFLQIDSIYGFLIFVSLLLLTIYLSIRNPGKLFHIINESNHNDNSSGIIMVLWLYKQYKDNNNIGYILFDKEESWLKGSRKFNNKHKHELFEKMIINLDCVGGLYEYLFLSPQKLFWKYNRNYKSNIEKMKEIFKDNNVKTKYTLSDHLSFNGNISIGISQRKRGRIFYGIPNIHTIKDDRIDKVKMKTLFNYIIKLVDGC